MTTTTKYYIPIVYVDVANSTRWTIAYIDISEAPNKFKLTTDKEIIQYLDLTNLNVIKTLLEQSVVFDETTLEWVAFRSFVDSSYFEEVIQLLPSLLKKEVFTLNDYSSLFLNLEKYDSSEIEDIFSITYNTGKSDLYTTTDNYSLFCELIKNEEFDTQDKNYLNVNLIKKDFSELYDDYTLNFYKINYDSSILEDNISLFTTITTNIDDFSSQDFSYLSPKTYYYDSFDFSENVGLYLNLIKEDFSEIYENYSLKLFTSRIETATISDIIIKRQTTPISNLTIQDYFSENYADWIGNVGQNWTIMYNNTPGTNFTYSLSDTVVIRKNGVIV